MSLKQFLEKQTLPGNTLAVLIVRKLQPYVYIVGDSSSLGLLQLTENPHHDKAICIGMTVKLIKPILIDDQTIQTNKNFKPIRNKEEIKIKPKEDSLKKFKVKTEENESPNNLITFQSIEENKSQMNIASLTVLVSNISRIIETKTSKYQIAGIIDTENQKTSINLYDSSIGKFELGNIYTLTRLKKTMIRKENEYQMRILTTKYTKICEATVKDQRQFGNVKLAEHHVNGTIIGVGELNSYKSCEMHWNKLDENSICPKCDGSPPNIKIDFNTDIYIQETKSEDIKSFLIFKRHVGTLTESDDHETIEKNLSKLEGRTCEVQFDDPENEDQQIIPKKLQIHT